MDQEQNALNPVPIPNRAKSYLTSPAAYIEFWDLGCGALVRCDAEVWNSDCYQSRAPSGSGVVCSSGMFRALRGIGQYTHSPDASGVQCIPVMRQANCSCEPRRLYFTNSGIMLAEAALAQIKNPEARRNRALTSTLNVLHLRRLARRVMCIYIYICYK